MQANEDITTPNLMRLGETNTVENVKSTPQETKGVDEIMNKITKRKDGRYQIKKQINGYKIDIVDKNKQDLILKYRAKISAYKKATKNIIAFAETKPKTEKDVLLKDWLEEYFNTYKKPFGKEKTKKEIKHYIEISQNSILGKMPISTITSHDIQKYINTLPYSRTKELIIRYLKAALKKYLKKDLFEDVQLEPKINTIRPPFNFEQQQTIWNNLNKFKYKNAIIFYLFTGIRKNELPKNFNNLFVDKNLIKIKCEKKRQKEEAYKYIDLSEHTSNFIKNNVETLKVSAETISKKFKDFLDELKIKGSLHTLRHTFTNNYYVLGINLKTLASWLGHSKTETTIEHYVTIDRTITKEKILKLYGSFLYKV